MARSVEFPEHDMMVRLTILTLTGELERVARSLSGAERDRALMVVDAGRTMHATLCTMAGDALVAAKQPTSGQSLPQLIIDMRNALEKCAAQLRVNASDMQPGTERIRTYGTASTAEYLLEQFDAFQKVIT